MKTKTLVELGAFLFADIYEFYKPHSTRRILAMVLMSCESQTEG